MKQCVRVVYISQVSTQVQRRPAVNCAGFAPFTMMAAEDEITFSLKWKSSHTQVRASSRKSGRPKRQKPSVHMKRQTLVLKALLRFWMLNTSFNLSVISKPAFSGAHDNSIWVWHTKITTQQPC
ncbi:hypothetical protein O9993_18150 [Vibrio lentus]|nr:hypothetical protein [Vibrio lentus]